MSLRAGAVARGWGPLCCKDSVMALRLARWARGPVEHPKPAGLRAPQGTLPMDIRAAAMQLSQGPSQWRL